LIDNIKVSLPIRLPSKFWKHAEDKKDFFKHFYIFPRYHYIEKGLLYKYEGSLENLKITIFKKTETLPDRLIIENSWHKFLKGNNHTNYTFSDLEATVLNLEEILSLSIMEADIKRMEYGCNIKMQSETVYNYLFLARGKEFHNMLDNGEIYGKKLHRDKYTFKCYNKKYQSNLKDKDGLLRIEMESKCKGYLRSAKIPVVQVKDLLIRDNLKLLGKDLMKKYDLIEKRVIPDLDELTPNQMNLWAAMNERVTRNYYKKNKPNTFKKYKKKLAEIIATANHEIHDEFTSKVTDKWNYLISN